MILELNVSEDIEKRLRERAAAAGQGVEQFVLEAVDEKLASVEQAGPRLTQSEWEARLDACIARHPRVSHFVDDSRESIYAGRGE
jgi:hypothetical protein